MIPLFKVSMSPEASERVKETLLSGYIGEGPRVEEFEQALEHVFGAPVLCTNSCTSALDLAYHLLGLGEGDEVISTPMTCLATNMPLALRGCNIKWADVDARTGNISPESVVGLLTSRTKAIVAVDWAGRPCDYDALRVAAPGVRIVEDAAHAFGATYKGWPIGQAGGDYVCFSFQAIKHLTTGDGGALKVPGYEEGPHRTRARLLRWYGLDRRDSTAMRCLQQASEAGFKYQMNDIAASIGLANLPYALEGVKARRWNAKYYDSFLPREITALFDPGAAYWLYPILVDDPAEFEVRMAESGVQVSQVHTRNDAQRCFGSTCSSGDPSCPCQDGDPCNYEDLPGSPAMRSLRPGLDAFSSHMVSIPVGEWLTSQDLEHIVSAVRQAVRGTVHAV